MDRLCYSFRTLLRLAVCIFDYQCAYACSYGEEQLEQEEYRELPAREDSHPALRCLMFIICNKDYYMIVLC